MASAYGPTVDFHRLMSRDLPDEDGADFADARRGFLGTIEHAEVRRADGSLAWSMKDYAFLDTEQPAPTVNPSL